MSVAVIGVGGAIAAGVGIAGAAATMYSANKAAGANAQAIAAQENAAQGQLALAQDQWDFQKNTYLPKSMQMADDAAALNKQIATKQMDASDYYLGVSKDSVAQAQKSYGFQDDYMARAKAYEDGTMGNTMADEAQADTQQAGGLQRAVTARNMMRRGVDPSSGAGMALQNDDQITEAAVGAGAQTAARRMARDKAEQMVGIAAGSGAAGFGTGLSAGGLATGANSAASGASTVGNTVLNGVNSGMATGLGGASSSFRGAGSTGYGLNNSWTGSPVASVIGNQLTGAAGSGAIQNIFDKFNKPGGSSYGVGANHDMSGFNPDGTNTGANPDFSDIRLKTNIQRVGQSPRGHAWYTWDWKTGGSGQGVIAQEVMLTDPSAVVTGADGYLRVFYSKV